MAKHSGSWIQHPITGKLIPRDEYVRPTKTQAYIHGDIESFVSPIDKTVISDRAQLRRHNTKHGVTDSRDYSPEFMKKKQDEREGILRGDTVKARQDRINDINEAIERHR